MRWSVALVAVTGCSQLFGLSSPVVGDGGGSGSDATDAAKDSSTDDGPPQVTCLAQWIAGPMLSSPVALAVDTTADETSPFVTADGLDLYYAKDGEVFLATRGNAGVDFSSPSKVNGLSSGSPEGKTFVSSNKLRAFFSSARNGGSASGGFDIFRGSRNASQNTFAVDQMYLATINTPANDIDPHLTDDLLHLYYATIVNAQQVIVRATRATATDPFGAPAAIAELVPTTGIDSGPTLTADERLIVFSSARASTFGATNLWYATRSSATQPFDAPKIVPTVNTNSLDEAPHVSPDGCELYFSSTTAADYDLYSSRIQ